MPVFEEKPELLELTAQAKEVQQTIIESEVLPNVAEEHPLGPTPDIAPEIHHKPDPGALRQWIDDLQEFADKHRGNAEAAKLLDKIESGELDDLEHVHREHLKEDVDAGDEQKGMVLDFHADSALEGAALDTHKPTANELMPLPTPPVILDDERGGGGDGGGGGGWPGGPPVGGENEGDGDAADKPDDPGKPQEKGALGKLVGKIGRALKSDKPETSDKVEKPAAKPDKPERAASPPGDKGKK